jgi:hypothetical protein
VIEHGEANFLGGYEPLRKIHVTLAGSDSPKIQKKACLFYRPV